MGADAGQVELEDDGHPLAAVFTVSGAVLAEIERLEAAMPDSGGQRACGRPPRGPSRQREAGRLIFMPISSRWVGSPRQRSRPPRGPPGRAARARRRRAGLARTSRRRSTGGCVPRGARRCRPGSRAAASGPSAMSAAQRSASCRYAVMMGRRTDPPTVGSPTLRRCSSSSRAVRSRLLRGRYGSGSSTTVARSWATKMSPRPRRRQSFVTAAGRRGRAPTAR